MSHVSPLNWPPATMATQHPDNASVPWWKKDGNAFITTQEEIGELMMLFRDFSIDEYMWDWEGKFVDEALGEKLFVRESPFLKEKPLGEAIHITFRIPAFDGTKMHRMARAFMNLLSLADTAHSIGAPVPPVREMFLPLTTSAEQLIKVYESFTQVTAFHRNIFHEESKHHDAILRAFRVTPLVEDVESMFGIRSILEPYWRWLAQNGGNADVAERGLRIFLARSDPALNSGIVPAVLAIKAALSITHDLGEEMNIAVHPVLGTGSLPFRGSVNPKYTEDFLTQYSGVRTYSIQSAFRYDYPQEEVERTLALIRKEAPQRAVEHVDTKDMPVLQQMTERFESLWKPTVEALAPLINRVARFVPPRRERLQHIGLFGYSRGMGEVTLPRAIGFTAALYSIGLPPELIATGRGLREAVKEGWMPLLEKYYPALRADLTHAGKYFNRENLEVAARTEPVLADVQTDIEAIEEFLEAPLGPRKPRHMIHRNVTSTIYHRLQEAEIDATLLERDIVDAGVIRRSLG